LTSMTIELTGVRRLKTHLGPFGWDDPRPWHSTVCFAHRVHAQFPYFLTARCANGNRVLSAMQSRHVVATDGAFDYWLSFIHRGANEAV